VRTRERLAVAIAVPLARCTHRTCRHRHLGPLAACTSAQRGSIVIALPVDCHLADRGCELARFPHPAWLCAHAAYGVASLAEVDDCARLLCGDRQRVRYGSH